MNARIVRTILDTGLVLSLFSFPISARPESERAADLSILPTGAQAAISGTLGRDDHTYHAADMPDGLRAGNERNGLSIDFTRREVAVSSGKDRFAFVLRAAGYGVALAPVPSAPPTRAANRVEYRRGTLTEWYVNGPLGVEQGFTLDAPPERRAAGPLTLELSVSGSLAASLDSGGRSVTLGRGPDALRYADLTAWDAAGRELPSYLELSEEKLLVRIDDAGARYPVVVDPFIQKAYLYPSDFNEIQACCSFGTAVAVSGDTIVIGAPNFQSGLPGLAYVFVRPPTGWAGQLAESAKLKPSDGEEVDLFGGSVAIDGDTVVVGAPLKNLRPNVDQGRAYVFVKPAGGWTGTLNENAKLTAADGAAGDEFGYSAAVSGDTIVIGAPLDDLDRGIFTISDKGSAYVFVKPAGGWAGGLTQNAKVRASAGFAESLGAHFGSSISVSGDTVVVGAPQQDVDGHADEGAAYVFVKPATGWAGLLSQSATLTTSNGAASDAFGASVATNGDAVFVGAPGHNVFARIDQGAAYVFDKPSGGWAGDLTPAAILFASDGEAGDLFGLTVSVSGDTVLISHYVKQPNKVYLFAKPPGGWVTTSNATEKVNVGDGSLQFFGYSGNTIVAGSDGLNYALVFVKSYFFGLSNFRALSTSVFPAGSTIPIRFRLDDANGTPIPDAEARALASSCDVQIFFSGAGRSHGCALYDGRAFHFDLKTGERLPPGNYTIVVRVLAGGDVATSESIDVQIR